MPVRADPRVRVRPRTVPGQPRARPASSGNAGRGTLDRDAPRLVLAGVRRRRDQPGRWVRPGPGKPLPRPTGPAGGLKGMLSPRSTGPALGLCRFRISSPDRFIQPCFVAIGVARPPPEPSPTRAGGLSGAFARLSMPPSPEIKTRRDTRTNSPINTGLSSARAGPQPPSEC